MTVVTKPEGFADILLGRVPREARAAAVGLLDVGVPPRSIYLDILGPALGIVGSRWQQGVVTVAQEHLATAVVSSIMATTLAPKLEQTPPVGRRVVLACTDGELHDVGLRMVGDFLEADGWDVFYLGALTPGDDLERLVVDVKPDAVGLSTALTTHLPIVAVTIAGLRALAAPPLVMVGGRAYDGAPDIAHRVGADVHLADAAAVSAFVRNRFAPAPVPTGG